MKKIAIIFTIVATTAMIFSSCGKYEEGPSVSLLTKKARITGTWTLSERTYNEVAENMEGYVIKYTLEKDGTGLATVTGSLFGSTMTITSDLEWEFDDTKENLRVRTKNQDSTVYGDWDTTEIIKLTNSECWLRNVETENGVTITTITKMTKD